MSYDEIEEEGYHDEEQEESIFVGNLSKDVTSQLLKDIFEENGASVGSIDIKSGYAFVYCTFERGMADNVIARMHGMELGEQHRCITVARSKGGGEAKRREMKRKSELLPTNTLFVVGFDMNRVREIDVKNFFKDSCEVVSADIQRSFSFVEFTSIADATTALERFNNTEAYGRTLFMEYAASSGLGKKAHHRGDRDYHRSRRDVYDRPPGLRDDSRYLDGNYRGNGHARYPRFERSVTGIYTIDFNKEFLYRNDKSHAPALHVPLHAPPSYPMRRSSSPGRGRLDYPLGLSIIVPL
jgi:RNA recognition motif-containing protein